MASPSSGHESYPQEANNDSIVSRLVQKDSVPWYKKPNLRLLYLIMLPTCMGVEMTSGFDSSMLNGLQAVPSWLEYYNHPHSALLGLVSAMYSLGCIFAVPFVPSVVDKFGRRYSIVFGSILMTIGAVLQGAAFNLTMFIIPRFILGFGAIFAIVAASSLISELSHPKERATMGSLFHTGYMVGSVSAAGVTLGTFSMPNNWAWRIPSFLQAIPSLLQLAFIWFLPESPRWLVSKGRGDEAYAILARYHAESNEDAEFVKAEYTQIEQTLAVEMKNARMSWKEVFSTPGMRKRVVIASFLALFMKWSGNSLISHFLSPILDNVGIRDNRTKNIVNFTRAGWSLVNCLFFALIVPGYPRRKIYLACTISVLVVLVAWTAASAEYSQTRSLLSSRAVLVLIFLYSPAYHPGYTALVYTYLSEIFPFHVRARGIAIFQWWGRIAAFISQVVDPIGINSAGWKYYLIYCVWIAFGVVFIYVMFPETSGRTLEELTFLFEDDDREQEIPRNAEADPLLYDRSKTYDAIQDDDSREISHVQRQG